MELTRDGEAREGEREMRRASSGAGVSNWQWWTEDKKPSRTNISRFYTTTTLCSIYHTSCRPLQREYYYFKWHPSRFLPLRSQGQPSLPCRRQATRRRTSWRRQPRKILPEVNPLPPRSPEYGPHFSNGDTVTCCSELGISVQSSQQILSVGPRLPATQSAAALLDSTNDVFRSCPPIDNLLDGGLRRGHVLELLGPPGTPKTALVLEIIKDFIENREDVLIIGIYLQVPASVLPVLICVLDPQNTVSPGVIDEKLRGETAAHSFSRAGAQCDTAV